MEKIKIPHGKAILVVFLIGATIFSLIQYLAIFRENRGLTQALGRIKEEVMLLEAEKQKISEEMEKEKQLQQEAAEENAQLTASLRADEEKLAKLDADLAQAQKTIEDLNTFIAIFKAENEALRDESEGLKLEVSRVSHARQELEERFNSIAELKKAIRELKIRSRKIKAEIVKKSDSRKSVEGNHGFLIKDGELTYPAKIKIEVVPLPGVNNGRIPDANTKE